ncbi:MAG: hypothetical protein RMJ56_11205 [Gemmataceae bacterium]|nr:hypothetical protein [Gemmata sp.]MDW8198157.1 hypothetical protein [Gemmataceae bacterium]
MVLMRLVALALILLQAGLAAAHAHHHPDLAHHRLTPHLHACELLERLLPIVPVSDTPTETDHDADAIALTDALATAPPSPPLIVVELTAVWLDRLLEEQVRSPAWLWVVAAVFHHPPNWLFLKNCALRI